MSDSSSPSFSVTSVAAAAVAAESDATCGEGKAVKLSSAVRLDTVRRHLTSTEVSSTSVGAKPLHEIPVVRATRELSTNPMTFLMDAKAKYPDCFYVDRGRGFKYLVVCDMGMYEDILTFE